MQQCFDFGKDELDRIEVGRVRHQVEQFGASGGCQCRAGCAERVSDALTAAAQSGYVVVVSVSSIKR
jgi:hypothetical protein